MNMVARAKSETGFPRIPDSEFTERLDNLKGKMRSQEIDLLVAYSNALDPGHVRYFADVVGLNEAAALVVPADGDPIVCSGPASQAWSAYKSRFSNVRIFPEVGEVATPEYQVGKMDTLTDLFQEIAAKNRIRKIGTVGRLIFPHNIYAQLQKVFPLAEIVESEPMVFELRARKSPSEIGCIRKAAEILNDSFADAVPKIQPGWTELDIMAEITAGILRRGAEDTGVDWTPMIPSGPEHSNLCMNRNSMRKVQESEIICLQAGATYEGYNAALCTPFVLGGIPAEIRNAVKSAYGAMEAIIAKLKPGATSREVNAAGKAVLACDGYARYSPYAMVHNIGCLECESPWMPDDLDYPVVEGMTVCVDVFLFRLPWGSFRIENTLAVTATGVELLTSFNEKFIPAHFA